MYKRIYQDKEKLKTCDKNHIFILNQVERINEFLKATSGTKRLSNLFRCPKWSSKDIEEVTCVQDRFFSACNSLISNDE